MAREDRRHGARRDAHHRLVEQGKPLRNPSRVQGEPALGRDTHRDEVGIVEPAPIVCDLNGVLMGGPELPSHDVPEHQMGQDVAALDHVSRHVLEQPLRAGHPAATYRRFAGGQQHQRKPERTPHRREGVFGVQMDLVGAL